MGRKPIPSAFWGPSAVFDQVAGIKKVWLVSPVPVSNASDLTPGLPATKKQEPVNLLFLLEFLPLVVKASLALTIYIVQKVRHS